MTVRSLMLPYRLPPEARDAIAALLVQDGWFTMDGYGERQFFRRDDAHADTILTMRARALCSRVTIRLDAGLPAWPIGD
jgi:predicted RNA binding protein YcfA (HicA-like mRNA interferase family)